MAECGSRTCAIALAQGIGKAQPVGLAHHVALSQLVAHTLEYDALTTLCLALSCNTEGILLQDEKRGTPLQPTAAKMQRFFRKAPRARGSIAFESDDGVLASFPRQQLVCCLVMRCRGGGCALSSPSDHRERTLKGQGMPGAPPARQAQRAPLVIEEERWTGALSPELAKLAQETRQRLSPAMRRLSLFDDPFLKALETCAIRLLRASWLKEQPADFRIQRRQDLETLEGACGKSTPFLSPEEAIELVCRGERLVGILTYGTNASLGPFAPAATHSTLGVV